MYTSGVQDFSKFPNPPPSRGPTPVPMRGPTSVYPAPDTRGPPPQFTNPASSGPMMTPYGPAPPSTSYAPSSSQSPNTQPKLNMEVRLFTNNREREYFDNLGDLFSIMKTCEALEKAYVRDSISAEDYKRHCQKLITQFKAAQNLTKDSCPDINKFMKDYRLDCKAAVKRLIEEGIPIGGATKDDSTKAVAETVQYFITAMDSLKLNMTAVDQLHPLLSDLYDCLCKVPSLPPDWEGKVKLKGWLVTLNGMKAHEELAEDQMRQMLFDLDSAYTAFHRSLSR